ncbi:MAG: hypothetical protein RLZZ562_1940 [Planctomycetota bacterium]
MLLALSQTPAPLAFRSPTGLAMRTIMSAPHATILHLVCALAAASGLLAQTRFDHLQKTHLPEVSSSVLDMLWFDADGDGDLDAQLIGEARQLLLRTGSLQFAASTAATASIASFRNRAAAMADFDGDGDLDIAMARDGINRLYANNGNGTFVDATSTAFGFSIAGSESVVASDLDADGDVDLVFGNVGAADVLMANDGTGRFVARPTALPNNGGSNGLALIDANGDGHRDLVRGGNAVSAELLLNNGLGVFGPAAPLPTVPGATLAIVTGDIDNDGDLDLLLPKDSGGCGLLRNLGNGAFADATSLLPTGLPRPTKAALFDLDQDGDLDIAISTTSRTVLLQNDPTRFVDVSSRLPGSDGAAFGIHAADADGDGDNDLFVSSGRLQLYVNERGGREFVDATGSRIDYVQPCSRLVDIDNDGDLDLLTAPFSNPAWGIVHVNDGKGTFRDETSARWNPTGTQRTFYAFAVGDVDRDGDQDIVLGQSGQDRLYLNDGSGRFVDATATHLPVDADRTTSLALADLDNDGDLDIAAANSLQANRVWRNDGTGRFATAANTMPNDAFWSQGIAAVDVDGDLDLDLIVADWNTQTGTQPRLYLNSGAATFVDATAGRLTAGRANDGGVASADIDRDGDMDVVALGGLYVNDGTGTFVDETTARMPGTVGLEPRFADFDGDGDLDLIGYQTLFLNDGTGRFVDDSKSFAGSGFGGAVPRPYAIGDVDRDGDADVVGSYDVFANLHRHLSSRLLPRIGGSYEVDVHATASNGASDSLAIVFVAARTLSRPIRIGSFGLLHCNPLTIFAADAISVPASTGMASRSWSVPNVAALAGIDFCAQALVMHDASPGSWRFTNVARETIVR